LKRKRKRKEIEVEVEVEVEKGRERSSDEQSKLEEEKHSSLSYLSYRCSTHHHRVGRSTGERKDSSERVARVEAGAVDARQHEAPRGAGGVVEKDHRGGVLIFSRFFVCFFLSEVSSFSHSTHLSATKKKAQEKQRITLLLLLLCPFSASSSSHAGSQILLFPRLRAQEASRKQSREAGEKTARRKKKKPWHLSRCLSFLLGIKKRKKRRRFHSSSAHC
jgi:hypothetical protein